MGRKKKKDEFKAFRSYEGSVFQTIKMPLKAILINYEVLYPKLNELVIRMNDLLIHTYQFIRLYILYHYKDNLPLPTIDEQFILYCMKTLGNRDNRGKKSSDSDLLDRLSRFYETEYQPLVNHEKTPLKNTTHLLPYLATQVHTSIHNNLQERFIQHFLRFINQTTTHITTDKPILHQFKKGLMELGTTNELFSEW
jgi:hypothetical protein